MRCRTGIGEPTRGALDDAFEARGGMAGVAGLEPVTSGVTGRRSNQLSYTPANRGPLSTPDPAPRSSMLRPCFCTRSRIAGLQRRGAIWARRPAVARFGRSGRRFGTAPWHADMKNNGLPAALTIHGRRWSAQATVAEPVSEGHPPMPDTPRSPLFRRFHPGNPDEIVREIAAGELAIGIGIGSLHLATARQYVGERDLAQALFDAALERAHACGIDHFDHFILHHQGRCFAEQGRLKAARSCFERALALRRQLGEPRFIESTEAALAELAEWPVPIEPTGR